MKIEFLKDRKGVLMPIIYFKFIGQTFDTFDSLTPEQFEAIFDQVNKHTEAHMALISLSKHFPGDKRKILSQFIECNWAELDDKVDISEDKLNYEYVPCPLRATGNCPFGENICMIKSFHQ